MSRCCEMSDGQIDFLVLTGKQDEKPTWKESNGIHVAAQAAWRGVTSSAP